MREPPARTIVRIVLIIVAVVLCLWLIYQVRRPLTWIFIAAFMAIALSGPVNGLSRHMRRGLAITIVYIGLLLIPIGLIALIVPPFITEGNRFAENLPDYSREVSDYVERNDRLRELDNDYDITQKLQEEADRLPSKLGGAANTLRDVGIGIVNSLFALLTILVLAAFMLAGGRTWVDAALKLRPPEQRVRLERALNRIAGAVGGYVAGALLIAFIAGVATYVVLTILGVPFRAPLAVIAGLFSLLPLVGATIAAVLIGLVTLFEDFPTATIVWVVWAIVYQQFENHVIQPQVQKRTVDVHPFITIVSVLLGSSLLGILGALLAIPIAASIQILLREYFDPRTMSLRQAPPPPPPDEDTPPPPEPAGDPSPA